jgi:hypothetical protein
LTSFESLAVRLLDNQRMGINIIPTGNFPGQINRWQLALEDCGNGFNGHFVHGFCGGSDCPLKTLGLEKLVSFFPKDNRVVRIRREDKEATSVLWKGEGGVERDGLVEVNRGGSVGCDR